LGTGPRIGQGTQTQDPCSVVDDLDVVEVTQGSSHGTKKEWGALLVMPVPQVSNKSVISICCLPDTEDGKTEVFPESPPARHSKHGCRTRPNCQR
jgi:hypothetical protein